MSHSDSGRDSGNSSGVPTTPTKRKRINHDYRRLSSSGYVDDYETGRERFSSASDKEESSPTAPKTETSPKASKGRLSKQNKPTVTHKGESCESIA